MSSTAGRHVVSRSSSVHWRAGGALALLLTATALGGTGCAHRLGNAKLSDSARRLGAEASAVRTVAYEEDYIDARLVYRALPRDAAERAALRLKLCEYLLGPLADLDVRAFRLRGGDSVVTDDLDRIVSSFRDALELYTPEELWNRGGLAASERERALLGRAAQIVATLFAPRGSETEVATSLLVLTTLDPKNRLWSDRLAELVPWLETGAQLSLTGAGPRGIPTPVDVLESAVAVWPAPSVVQRLADGYLRRQDRLANLLRRPLGANPGRAAIGELLLEGDTVQATAMNVAGVYLRAGQMERASAALAKVAGKPGDDPELRQLVAKAARPRADRADYLALARRFLPRIEALGGTSNDRVDLGASFEVINRATALFPEDAEVRVLASRVALLNQDVYLSLRYLEEAQPLMEKSGAAQDERAALAGELVERSFLKLRQRMGDSEHIEPATREAELLRQRADESRRRFGADRLKNRNAEIDVELARGLLNAGLVDRAEALLMRASRAEEASADIALELAKLATKRGDPRRAAELLDQALSRHEEDAPKEETIPFVELQAKLAYALGNSYELAAKGEEARKAWRVALRGWERLVAEHQRRKNVGESAEALMEAGRLSYLLGRQSEGVAKFVEAIELHEARDQSYIDSLSFLVQRGDVEAALDIYRRALARPSRTVSEYVKVYASLWIVDLTRRAGRGAEPTAEAFLRELAGRRVVLRPQRVAPWYIDLARLAIGARSYDQLVPKADTAGKKAELYFYEAMRRLAAGRSDDAHLLWNKVLETRMVEFLEFDMAARYLRSGAPTRAVAEDGASEAI
jgi:tetratricopeptide (TPR) repeat protein